MCTTYRVYLVHIVHKVHDAYSVYIHCCTFCKHRSIHPTTPEQSSRQYCWTDRLQNRSASCQHPRSKYLEFIKILHFTVSELLPDIRVIQSGAKCRYDFMSDIHFGSNNVQKPIWGKCVRPWVKRVFLNSLGLEPWSYIYIYVCLLHFAYRRFHHCHKACYMVLDRASQPNMGEGRGFNKRLWGTLPRARQRPEHWRCCGTCYVCLRSSNYLVKVCHPRKLIIKMCPPDWCGAGLPDKIENGWKHTPTKSKQSILQTRKT